MDLVETIYKLTQTFQIQKIWFNRSNERSVVSIPSNIAEELQKE
jgi:four helix bundle protein